MPRSVWRGPLLHPLPLASAIIKTNFRNTTILPSFVGKKFLVHNGRDYLPLLIEEGMVGKRLAEFVPTKVIPVFKKGKS